MTINDNIFDIAFKFHTLGLCVIPSGGGADGKAALIQWKRYQTERPTDEQIEEWQRDLNPTVWAMITGPVSGCFVIDCDTEESTAMMEAAELSPHVKSPKGHHFYIRWPSQPISNSVRRLKEGCPLHTTRLPVIAGKVIRQKK